MKSVPKDVAEFRVKAKERLKWVLETHHITVKNAADVCGVSKATIMRWLKVGDPTFIGFDEIACLAKHIRKPIGIFYPQSGWELEILLSDNPLLSASALEMTFLTACLQASRALLEGQQRLAGDQSV